MKNIQINHEVFRVPNLTHSKIQELEELAFQEESEGLESYETKLWGFLSKLSKELKPILTLDKGYNL